MRAYQEHRANEADILRGAGEDARYWTASASERLAMPDDVLIRNGAAAFTVARKADPRPVLAVAAGGAAPVPPGYSAA